MPLYLLLTVLWTAVLKKHLVWLEEVEEGSRSCQLNCRSHMPAIRGSLLHKSLRPRPPLGFSPLPSQLWGQPTLWPEVGYTLDVFTTLTEPGRAI